jgi:cyclic lactone autoinducer peptide
MKKGLKGILVLTAALFTLVAASMASSACFWGLYQPEEPKS